MKIRFLNCLFFFKFTLPSVLLKSDLFENNLYCLTKKTTNDGRN
jgi:hypothetical protein